jgi:hypothetical protein
MSPEASFVEIDGEDVVVRMAWAFGARFARSAVDSAVPVGPRDRRSSSRGVHGWAGRWLVNGSGDGILTIDLVPEQEARVLGFPVRLRQLQVSVDDPTAVAHALTGA